ncbi:hypothetical protein V1504DRAFT_472272 [Lipomyces starkeyi]
MPFCESFRLLHIYDFFQVPVKECRHHVHLVTSPSIGLSVDEHGLPGTVTFDDAKTSYLNGTSKHLDFKEVPSPSQSQSPQAFGDRIRVYGRNVLPEKKPTPLWKLMWQAYNDKILLLLTAAAVMSLALGLYETFGADHPPGSPMPVDWAICIAILIVVLVGSLNDY